MTWQGIEPMAANESINAGRLALINDELEKAFERFGANPIEVCDANASEPRQAERTLRALDATADLLQIVRGIDGCRSYGKALRELQQWNLEHAS